MELRDRRQCISELEQIGLIDWCRLAATGKMRSPKSILLCGPSRERLESVYHSIPLSAREYEYRPIYTHDLRQVLSAMAKHGYGIAVLFLDLVGQRDSDHLITIMLRTQLASPKTLILLRGPGTRSTRNRNSHDGVRLAAESLRSGAFNYFHPEEPLERIGRSLRCAVQFASFATNRNTQSERLLLAQFERVQSLYVAESRNEAISSHQKGIVLEDLACAMFRTIDGWSKLVPRKRIGQSEEFDVEIQNESADHFWQQYGTRIFVECKNSRQGAGAPDFKQFQQKVASHGPTVRLGFLIARSFTAAVSDELHYQRERDKIVVPLDYRFALASLVYSPRRAERLKSLVRDGEDGVPSWRLRSEEPDWAETA